MDHKKNKLILKYNNKLINDNRIYTLGLQGYHVKNCDKNLGVSEKELISIEPPKVPTTSAQDVLEEFFRNNTNLNSEVEGRIIVK